MVQYVDTSYLWKQYINLRGTSSKYWHDQFWIKYSQENTSYQNIGNHFT